MPKHMTKGPFFNRMAVNHSPPSASAVDPRPGLLAQLRAAAVNLEDVMTVGAVGATQPGGASGAKQHVRNHWLGAGSPPFSQTGWWRNWKGEPEKVLRCGLIRALEVAMGLAHACPEHPSTYPSTDPARRPPDARNLPVDYFWVCGVSRFEVFVSWNPHQVSVIVVTPGFPFSLVEYPDEYVAGTSTALDAWTANDVGTVYIGQNEDLPNASDDKATQQMKKRLTVMKPGIVTHRLNEGRGGSGQP